MIRVRDDTPSAGAYRDRTAIPRALDFAVSVREAEEVTIVDVRGDLDCYTAPQLRAVLVELADGPRRVILDVGGSTFIDSTGLGVLVGALKRLRLQGGDMALRSLSPRTERLFEVTGVSKLFQIN